MGMVLNGPRTLRAPQTLRCGLGGRIIMLQLSRKYHQNRSIFCGLPGFTPFFVTNKCRVEFPESPSQAGVGASQLASDALGGFHPA
jgi:hypothetical protein